MHSARVSGAGGKEVEPARAPFPLRVFEHTDICCRQGTRHTVTPSPCMQTSPVRAQPPHAHKIIHHMKRTTHPQGIDTTQIAKDTIAHMVHVIMLHNVVGGGGGVLNAPHPAQSHPHMIKVRYFRMCQRKVGAVLQQHPVAFRRTYHQHITEAKRQPISHNGDAALNRCGCHLQDTSKNRGVPEQSPILARKQAQEKNRESKKEDEEEGNKRGSTR